MDDFELGLSSGSFYKDDFYESFQAPKFYDFINPRDSANADEWFLRSLDCKEFFGSAVKSAVNIDSDHPLLGSLKKSVKSKDSVEDENSAENEDPNHAVERALKPDATEKSGPKKPTQQKLLNEQCQSPAGQRSRTARCAAKISQAVPATVPQKKVLATRKAALEIKRQPAASKSLLESFRKEVQAIQAPKETTSRVVEGGPEPAGKNYSSEFEESCKRSDEELPKCRRAIGQGGTGRDSVAAAYVVEQATMLESAIKLLNLGDEDRNAKVCTEIMRDVCADSKTGAAKSREILSKAPETKQVFAFTAVRDENSRQRKRKSKELKTRARKDHCAPKAASSVLVSPPASLSSSRLATAGSKRPRVTCPQPFRLRTEERGALKEIEFNKRMEHYIALKDGLVTVPTVVCQPAPKVEIPIRKKFHFQRVERPPTRPDNRSPVEVSIEMLAKDLSNQKLETETEAVRKPARSHAVPSFTRPFKPQRSTKKLTVPVEPKFHAIHARRTCTRHNNHGVVH